MKYLYAALIVLCLILITDCTCATPQWRGGTVTDKIIIPGWVEYESDAKGHTSSHYHSPQYYICAEVEGRVGRVMVNFWDYDNWQRGQACEVQFRKGKLMTYGYLSLRRVQW